MVDPKSIQVKVSRIQLIITLVLIGGLFNFATAQAAGVCPQSVVSLENKVKEILEGTEEERENARKIAMEHGGAQAEGAFGAAELQEIAERGKQLVSQAKAEVNRHNCRVCPKGINGYRGQHCERQKVRSNHRIRKAETQTRIIEQGAGDFRHLVEGVTDKLVKLFGPVGDAVDLEGIVDNTLDTIGVYSLDGVDDTLQANAINEIELTALSEEQARQNYLNELITGGVQKPQN